MWPSILSPGTHGTTFGGNPLACAAANAVLDVMLEPSFLPTVDARARKLWFGLLDIVTDYPDVFEDARGAGLLLGVRCAVPNTEVQAALFANGLLSVTAGDNVVRFAPPLVLTDEDVDAGLSIIRATGRALTGQHALVAAK